MPGVEAECKAAGMDAYIAKPFDRDHLEAYLDDFLARDPSAAAAEGFPSSDTPLTAPLSRSPTPSALPAQPVDLKALDKLAAADATFKLDLIDTFIAVGTAQLDDIQYALERNTLAAIAQSAHKLKANAGCVFAIRVSARAAQVEARALALQNRTRDAFGDTQARSDADSGSLAALVEELRAELTRAIDFLRPLTLSSATGTLDPATSAPRP
jgi:HPt (histidine-containing phosphotransfer) domain-containing protein